MAYPLLIGRGNTDAFLLSQMANRHGLIAGATGTGKTVTLKVLAENFSQIGVPIFLVDVKGDLATLASPGEASEHLTSRLQSLGISDFPFWGFPVELWDVFATSGITLRTTITEFGPAMLARLLGLNDTQIGVLNIAFRLADDEGLLLIDLKDLRAMLNYLNENAASLTLSYGQVSKPSIGAILRALLVFEEQGGSNFFGEPALELNDFLRTSPEGKGVINILSAEKLLLAPNLYAAVLLWLLSELFENLPEVGDMGKPKMVLFFDEAHLIFKDTPKVLLDKIEQVVRLIRSKGVSVFFISQSPQDIPEIILAQLGNRIQHALRAYTPKEQKNIRAVADSFYQNPALDTASVLTTLKTGEALVSFLDGDGRPTMVEQVMIMPPHSRFGTLSSEERNALVKGSLYYSKYAQSLDRESAYERLAQRTLDNEAARAAADAAKANAQTEKANKSKASATDQALAKMVTSFVGTLSRSIGRDIARGVLGSIKKK